MTLQFKMEMLMQPLHNYILAVLCILIHISVQAQDSLDLPLATKIDTSAIYLPTISIDIGDIPPWTGNREPYSTKTIYLNQKSYTSLADALRSETGIFVKTYGAGALATLSMRGGGAAQTPITWEDIPIMNPMLGQTDLSLLSSSFVNQVDIHQTEQGNINLSTGHFYFDDDIEWYGNAMLRTGSWGQVEQSFEINHRARKIAIQLNCNYKTANNNFNYLDPNTKTIEKQTNNQQEQYGGLLNITYQGDRHRLKFQTWSQYNFRQIAPTLLQTNSQDYQIDISSRNQLSWSTAKSFRNNKWHWYQNIKTAFTQEQLNFRGSGIISNSQFRLYFLNITERFALTNHNSFLQHSFKLYGRSENYQALSNGYPSGRWQNRASLQLSYEMTDWDKNITWETSIKQLWTNQTKVFPAFSSKFSTIIKEKLKLTASVARNNRIPTLNDLYWEPGGNPNLNAERRWDTEVSINYRSEYPDFYRYLQPGIHFSITAYSSWIKDWILWQPNTTNGYWTATNVHNVWSRGIEQSFKWRQPMLFGRVEFANNYNFTLATQITPNNSNTHKKQLIYVPMHKNIASIRYQIRRFDIIYQHEFVSHSFLTSDNQERLPFYQTGNIYSQYIIDANDLQIHFFGKINNIWNVDYQIMSQRPMPRRNWELGIKLYL